MSDSKSQRPGFLAFDLHDQLVRGLRDAGFQEPRPIQAETIPEAMKGCDVLGLAQTGTGKTAAFALPLLDRLLRKKQPGPRALVLAPTRELANQIATEIEMLAKHTRINTVTIFGGVPHRVQIKSLRRKPEIVVGCPGRVLDLVEQGELRLGNVETLVLDEADHMFDMGFLPDVRRVLEALPSRRQNLMFSATMPGEIRGLADDLLRKPHVVELTDSTPAETIDHALYPVLENRKRDLLEHFLGSDDCRTAIVFTRTKHRARRIARQLQEAGHKAIGLQGDMTQAQRDRAMRGFRAKRYNVLVATDIVARGIDVSGVSHVINYDVPNTPEAYTHRIGRTGRAEAAGIACTFVTSEDHRWVHMTERMIGEPIPRREVDGIEAPPIEAPKRSVRRKKPFPKKSGGEQRGRRRSGPRRRRRATSRDES